MITVHDKQFRPHIKEDLIQKEVERIGRELMVSHSENAPFFLGVLNGSFMFFSDLMKQVRGRMTLLSAIIVAPPIHIVEVHFKFF